MGEEREGDCRVPFLYGLFFTSCLIGGIVLTLWLIDAKGSQPWFPIFALVLIGFPWIFWALICCYTINKRCFMRGDEDGGGPRITSKPTKPKANADEGLGSHRSRSLNSSDKRRKVQFGPVIVVDGAESSTASRESELPLNRAGAS